MKEDVLEGLYKYGYVWTDLMDQESVFEYLEWHVDSEEIQISVGDLC